MNKIIFIAFFIFLSTRTFATSVVSGTASINNDYFQAVTHFQNKKINYGGALKIKGQKNTFLLKGGNLYFTSSISKLNKGELSSSITPFSSIIPSKNYIEAQFESDESYSKPLGLFSQYSHTNKNNNQFLINALYIPQNNTLAFSTSYDWNKKDVTLKDKKQIINKTKYGIAFTAGLFPYEQLCEDSWFLSQKYYDSGYLAAANASFYINKNAFFSQFMINIYNTPFDLPFFTLRNENFIKFNQCSCSLSQYFNYGLFSSDKKVFSTSSQTLKECYQIKLNVQNETKNVKKGITCFANFDLYNICHTFKTQSGISKKTNFDTIAFSLASDFIFEPQSSFYVKNFDLKFSHNINFSKINISYGILASFLPSKNFQTWKNEQKLSLGLKTKGDFSLSSNIDAIFYERGLSFQKTKIEYSVGASYKKKWFSASLSYKDSITL